MGNRAVLSLGPVADNTPAIYLHWHGSPETVEEFLADARAVMAGRGGDPTYAAARLVGVIHTAIAGNLSMGLGVVGDFDGHEDNGTYEIDLETLTIASRNPLKR